ncbi:MULTISPECIES: cupin-like domain-containing protein [Methylosinus]|uniref:cupin-like domain-containing protein n=1 Tax=Methylosinus TaxID=425 RepID=UPI0002F3FB7A|nr:MULTISPECIES: cupin-like domain-containing protein [Methylosinus]OBS51445.1 transcription factor jumonji [Methylosinus sp. 3S-1]
MRKVSGFDYVVEERDALSAEEFTRRHVAQRRPVLLRGALSKCGALAGWSLAGLRERAGATEVTLKDWSASGIRVTRSRLDAYIDGLDAYERAIRAGGEAAAPSYLHDIPLTSVLPGAARDLAPFPQAFFPGWYGAQWTLFAQMFLGPSTSLTPLHFDCLLTHNLFFQVWGRKRFILVPHEELAKCYPRDWRWCRVDAERPDFERFPLFREARRAEIVVEAGDLLYMPPGVLHHVRSLECSLSFNVDWHTRGSVARGVAAAARGMPAKNVYYNLLIALGLWGGVPMRHVLPYYKSYLSYIS